MAATRRLQKELSEIRARVGGGAGSSAIRGLHSVAPIDEANLLLWTALLTPEAAPYAKGAFRLEVAFPAEYPFKPPRIVFKTRIYHPNVDEKGQVCLPIITAENWKPATRTDQVLESLIRLIAEPEPEHPLRADVAEEYVKDRKRFLKTAEEWTRKYGDKRPPIGSTSSGSSGSGATGDSCH